MTATTLESSILVIVNELTAIPVEELSLDDNLQTDINLDSVSALELLGMIDEEFGIDVSVEEVRDVKTIRDIVTLTRGYLDAG